MNYKTYLFDFDYTLADSSRGIVKCFRIVLTRHQYVDVTDEAIKRTIGKTLEESFSILTGITEPEQLTAFRQEYRLEADLYMNANTQLFPDTLSTLKALKAQGARIGIISTKYRFRILSFLEEYLPEDFLDIVVGGEDVSAAKPSPEGVLFALKQLGSTPQETLYIGDSTVDAETARNAGVDFAGVLNGMTTADELRAYPHRMIMENLGDMLNSQELHEA
ncbi:HAD-IA family hydrolase [uncultured Bacteroides sp.]|uniref:HAD-IA family hydrolase n=1 Tax=uncultured Bacteroides sp. TaxID=162156 RepID=UPI0025E11611|nr:HAD-IA family hydrolase [uncultured Bacteroides sp.]